MADSRASTTPAQATRLRPCPRSPNCVSTLAEEDGSHRMKSIPLEGSPEDALERFQRILSSRARTEVVEVEGLYLRAEETSALLRFVDDVEIEIHPEAGVIHYRSASRLGWSDLGVNRRRMEEIRAAYVEESDS